MKTYATCRILAIALIATLAALGAMSAREMATRETGSRDVRGEAIREGLVLDRMFIGVGPVAIEAVRG